MLRGNPTRQPLISWLNLDRHDRESDATLTKGRNIPFEYWKLTQNEAGVSSSGGDSDLLTASQPPSHLQQNCCCAANPTQSVNAWFSPNRSREDVYENLGKGKKDGKKQKSDKKSGSMKKR